MTKTITITGNTIAIIVGIAAALGGFSTAIVNVTTDPHLLLIGTICGIIGTALTAGVTAYNKAVSAAKTLVAPDDAEKEGE